MFVFCVWDPFLIMRRDLDFGVSAFVCFAVCLATYFGVRSVRSFRRGIRTCMEKVGFLRCLHVNACLCASSFRIGSICCVGAWPRAVFGRALLAAA